MSYKTNDSIKKYLDNKYGDRIKEKTVDYFLVSWKEIIEDLENIPDVDNYLNYLTFRESLEDMSVMINHEDKERFMEELSELDEKFKSKTKVIDKSLWLKDRWYYRRVPQDVNPYDGWIG